MDIRNINGYVEETFGVDKKKTFFTDSISGETLDADKVNSLIKDSNGDDLPAAIDITIEATHTGITKNYTEYMPDRMKKSAPTWLTPYKKPFLANHNPYSPTLGRVKAFKFKRSELNPDKETIQLVITITDTACIKRHLDKTALTYSIGAMAKQIYCSICGIDILNSDSFCGHWKGNKYTIKKDKGTGKGKEMTCIWQIGDMEYVEISEVNMPADVWAQVLKVDIPGQSNDSNNSSNNVQDNRGGLDMADTILGGVTPPVVTPPVVTPPATPIVTPPVTNQSTTPPVVTPPVVDPTITNEVENTPEDPAESTKSNTGNTPTKTIAEYEAELKLLKDESLADKIELKNVQEELETVKVALSSIEEGKKVAEQAVTDMVTKNKVTNTVSIELAKTIKRIYAESVVDAKMVLEEITEATKNSEMESLASKTANELHDMLGILKGQIKVRKPLPRVTNENVGDNGALKVPQVNVDVAETAPDKKAQPLTAASAAEKIINNPTLRG